MRTFRADVEAPPALRGASAALGNMDGVHLGHQAVITAARRAANGGRLAAAVFDPHPREVFQPDAPPFRIQTSAQRSRKLARLGVDLEFQVPFTSELAALSDAAFVEEILLERLGLACVCVGQDFRFGQDRMGDAGRLRALGAARGLHVEVIAPVDVGGGEKISSSDIRSAIANGAPERAAALLGGRFAIEGVVIAGAQRGRTIGFATANVSLGRYVRPRFGVYATLTDIGDGAPRPGVTNIGVKPTLGGALEPLMETHLFDFSGDLYGRVIESELVAFLREERRFDSFDALTRQIARDAEAARARLG